MTRRRKAAGLLLFVLLLAGALVYWLNVRGDDPATYSQGARNEAADLARGRALVVAGDCIACHTARGAPAFAGGRPIETPFGTVYSSNITPDVGTGIGGWTRADFWRALHNGRSKNGRLLYPAFPYANFTRVTPADADAMFDYLRSLPAVKQPRTEHALRFPYDTQVALALWRALFFRAGVFEPDRTQTPEWNRGAYLVQGLGHCDACHAARNVFGAVSRQLDLGGGLIPMQNWYAPPLLSSNRSGISSWTAADIEALLQTGVSRHASAMGPMAEVVFRSTQYLAAPDAHAIATYLLALPASERDAAVSAPAFDPGTVARGAAIYRDHCVQCHGSKGQGAFPAYPPLDGNPSVMEPVAANAIKAVLSGGYAPVTSGNPRPYGMPPFLIRLDDGDIAAVLTYVRASWGRGAGPVTTFDVQRYR